MAALGPTGSPAEKRLARGLARSGEAAPCLARKLARFQPRIAPPTSFPAPFVRQARPAWRPAAAKVAADIADDSARTARALSDEHGRHGVLARIASGAA